MRPQFYIVLLILIFLSFKLKAQDSLAFKGMFSAYTHFNHDNKLSWLNGARYIPQLNYQYQLPGSKLIDFEASANIYGNVGIRPFDSTHFSGDIKPYRFWCRFSTNQFEVRIGLQKINFGSASILRPLMWFDQIDPRDPLKLTDGVWGTLARYYFLNNANIWLWGLYGNENRKGWETFNTKKKIPEFGGRFQTPLPKGEAGFSYHHRNAVLSDSIKNYDHGSENRFGFDAKFDVVVGCWIEASWANYNRNLGISTNQEIINVGMDYTFGLGNGLSFVYEQLFASSDVKPFEFRNTTTFSLLNLSYPIGMFDNISTIIYYDWSSNKAYNFLNWQRQFKNFSLYLMGYRNPKNYNIPTQGLDGNIYAGTGVQVMVVINY